ncbi:type II secretion system F family protein [uncultured Cellulomonas sp.]|uniref:type II secretion system F family protein n=1 Tax=uncultured Cellulomonas sp. TaxID=189682 RepID=UPI00261BF290|nr:hypothetical protein [uncultured Cellulomonas sp.]
MSWLLAATVAAAVLVLRGPVGRSPARAARAGVGRGRPDPVPGTGAGAGAGAGARVHRGVLGALTRHLPGPGRTAGDRPDLAPLVTDVAARLRSGADPGSAWSQVLGVPVPPGGPGVDDLTRHRGERAQAVVVVVAGRLAAELGAPLAPLLDGVAQALVAQAEADGDRRAALAGPRATARVLTGLPALGVVLGTAVGADPVGVLLDGAVGSAALGAGVVLVVTGRAWTAHLARSAAAAGPAT